MIKILLVAALTTLMADAASGPNLVSLGSILAHPYSIELVTRPGHIGEQGMAKAIFKPTPGFKWNKDFPASFTIQSKDIPIATPVKVKSGREDFKINGRDRVLCVPFIGKENGRYPVEGLVNFSVCNEKECLVFRNQKLTLTFIVVGK